jgi:hypothetical protein
MFFWNEHLLWTAKRWTRLTGFLPMVYCVLITCLNHICID